MWHNKDILWKGLLEWVFDDLLRFVFPEAEQVFDWSVPGVFMDKEFERLCPEPKDGTTIRVVDKLAKVKLRKRGKKYALIHVEAQGQTKKKGRSEFGKRMLQYYMLISSKHPLPLSSIAIFTGGDGHLFPESYTYSFLNTRLPFQYNTINIRDHSDEKLGSSENPFAWVMLIAKQALLRGKNRDYRLLEKKWIIFKKLYYKGLFEDRKLQAILLFMDRYVPFEDPEISRTFRERMDSLTGKKNTMDIFEQVAEMKIEEAKLEGQKEAKDAVIRNLLETSEFSDEKIASVAEVSVNVVAAIRKQRRAR